MDYGSNLAQDLFRCGGGFYNFQGGTWFRATGATGPWVPSEELPPVFSNTRGFYFNAPPAWAQGRKTGWGGASAAGPDETKKRPPIVRL